MVSTKKNNSVLFNTDGLAIRLWHSLRLDFENGVGKIAENACKALLSDVKDFRNYRFPDYSGSSIPRFKRWYQLENLYKKYRFQDDLYSDSELTHSGYKDYLAFQIERSEFREFTLSSHLVLQEARKIAREILGPLSKSEVFSLCRFGRNSSVGSPFAHSYLDVKLTSEKALTGSLAGLTKFFDDYLPDDHLLSRITRWQRENVHKHESVPLIQVPKNWKTFRFITPLQLLDLFISYGYGRVIERRLEGAGLSIRKGQQRHRNVIGKFSRTRTHVTLDAKRGSDNFTSELCNRILPREWYVFLKSFTSHTVTVNGKGEWYTASILPMGNGATFPLETLLFYCLLKSIGNLLGIDGFFSVYGDDMIFPRKIYRYVLSIFKQLGIGVNVDKTFDRRFFRESCGADYFHGIDVRPFMLPVGGDLTESQFIVYLHKVINGLLRRWDYDEIENTMRLLLIELAHVCGFISRVPPSFPDTAGVRTPYAEFIFPRMHLLPYSDIRCTHTFGSRSYSFLYYHETSAHRAVLTTYPYFWDSLRQKGINDDESYVDSNKGRVPTECSYSPIIWKQITKSKMFTVGSRTVSKKVITFKPFTADKQRSVVEKRVFGLVRGKTGLICTDWI